MGSGKIEVAQGSRPAIRELKLPAVRGGSGEALLRPADRKLLDPPQSFFNVGQ